MMVVKAAHTYKPNIIVFFTNDQGYGDVGYNGSKIKKTNIEALVADDMKFTGFYVEGPRRRWKAHPAVSQVRANRQADPRRLHGA